MPETLATVTSITPATTPDAEDRPDPLRLVTGRRKAAILLLQLDRRSSAKVLAQMSSAEIEELAAEIARARDVTPDTSSAVLREFGSLVNSATSVSGGMDASRDLLRAALGDARAGEIIDRLSSSMVDIPFKFLANADSRQLLSFLSDEHPQTIALVLAHISAPLASNVLAGLTPELQADVAHRIATMESTAPEVIAQVQAGLERRMSNMMVAADLSAVGGVQPLVDIINRADRGTEKLILEGLERRNPELADEVRSRMFVFEDLTNLDDRAVQLVLRQVEVSQLAVALKGVAAGVRNKVTNNMSERAGETLLEEIEVLGPVRIAAVEEAQTEIVRVIRQLEEDGQIVVRRGGQEDEFVA